MLLQIFSILNKCYLIRILGKNITKLCRTTVFNIENSWYWYSFGINAALSSHE